MRRIHDLDTFFLEEDLLIVRYYCFIHKFFIWKIQQQQTTCPKQSPRKQEARSPTRRTRRDKAATFWLRTDLSDLITWVLLSLLFYIVLYDVWILHCVQSSLTPCAVFSLWISSTTQMFHKGIFEWWWGERNFEKGVCTIGEWNVGEKDLRLIPEFYVEWWKMYCVGRKIEPATFCAGNYTSVWSDFLAKAPSFRIENIDYYY